MDIYAVMCITLDLLISSIFAAYTRNLSETVATWTDQEPSQLD